MRIKLCQGKQKELIINAKGRMTWEELSKKLKVGQNYLSNDIRKEIVLLSEENYKVLCKLGNCNFDRHIIERLPDNWGKSKGGKNSAGSLLKEVNSPEESIELAEFIGIMLGDGNMSKIKSYKVGTYNIRIVGDSRYDYDYLLNFIKPRIENLFGVKVQFGKFRNQNANFVHATGLKLVNFLESKGLVAGNKIKNQVTIPNWIGDKKDYLRACLRGLIDTDGSVFKMSNKDPQLIRISFTNYNHALLKDVRNSFVKLGFNPSKIIKDKQFFLSRKSDIEKYLKEIGFSNIKHLNRLKMFQTAL